MFMNSDFICDYTSDNIQNMFLMWIKPFLYVYCYINMTVYIIQFHCFSLSELNWNFLSLHASMALKYLLKVSSPESICHIYWGNLCTSSSEIVSENCGT
jgi:hypothetical protein